VGVEGVMLMSCTGGAVLASPTGGEVTEEDGGRTVLCVLVEGMFVGAGLVAKNLRSSVMLRFRGCGFTGTYFCRNFLLQRVILPEPSTRTPY